LRKKDTTCRLLSFFSNSHSFFFANFGIILYTRSSITTLVLTRDETSIPCQVPGRWLENWNFRADHVSRHLSRRPIQRVVPVCQPVRLSRKCCTFKCDLCKILDHQPLLLIYYHKLFLLFEEVTTSALFSLYLALYFYFYFCFALLRISDRYEACVDISF